VLLGDCVQGRAESAAAPLRQYRHVHAPDPPVARQRVEEGSGATHDLAVLLGDPIAAASVVPVRGEVVAQASLGVDEVDVHRAQQPDDAGHVLRAQLADHVPSIRT
jgi:hypothetical protein